MRWLLLGSILAFILLAVLEWIAPWDRPTERVPTPEQHTKAVEAGWIPGTDGYYRAIYGDDAY